MSVLTPVDALPVNGALAKAISSDWAYDHAADLAAHTKDIGQVIRTGQYFYGYPVFSIADGVTLAANTLYSMLFLVARNMTVDRIAIRVTVAGAAGTVARLGIYADGTNLYPGALKLDAGTVAVDATGVKTITFSQALTKGIYHCALVSDGTPKLYLVRLQPLALGVLDTLAPYTYSGWTAAQAYGALPDPFTAGGSLTTEPPCMPLRLLSLD